MTVLIPFAVGKPLQRFPWVTSLLLILCGIGFALARGLGEARIIREWGFVPGSFNVINLFCACVEDLLGRIRFAAFYFIGGASD